MPPPGPTGQVAGTSHFGQLGIGGTLEFSDERRKSSQAGGLHNVGAGGADL